VKHPENTDEKPHERGKSAAKEEKKHLQKRCVLPSAGHDGLHHTECDEQAVQEGIKEHKKEVLMVEVANTIVNPRTVVVHLQNANAAHATVVAPVRLVPATPLTVPSEASSLKLCHFPRVLGWLHDVFVVDPRRIVWDLARVCQCATDIAHH